MSAFQELIDRELDAADAIHQTAISEGRALTSDEQSAYDEHFAAAERHSEHAQKQDRLQQLRSRSNTPVSGRDPMAAAQPATGAGEDRSTGQGGQAPREVRVAEPDLYRPNGPNQWFRDLYLAGDKDQDSEVRTEARERMQRHARYESETRAINTTAGTGGDAVAPTYLQTQYIELIVSAAPVLSRFTRLAYTSSMGRTVNIPKLSTGTEVAKQTENSGVQNTDISDTLLTANVYTIAGGQDVSLQLLEHSNPSIDQIVLRDLAKRNAVQKAQWCLNGSGSGQPLGLAGVSGIHAESFTSGSPTFTLLWPVLNAAVNDVATTLLRYPSDIVMAVRRWSWCVNARDSQNRPLISALNPMNALGTGNYSSAAPGEAEGTNGRQIAGVPVTAEGNVITTDGTGTNQDQIFVGALDESYLWESGAAFAISYEEKFSNGTVVFRSMEDMAFLGSRRPEAVTLITGTGLTTPAFS